MGGVDDTSWLRFRLTSPPSTWHALTSLCSTCSCSRAMMRPSADACGSNRSGAVVRGVVRAQPTALTWGSKASKLLTKDAGNV